MMIGMHLPRLPLCLPHEEKYVCAKEVMGVLQERASLASIRDNFGFGCSTPSPFIRML